MQRLLIDGGRRLEGEVPIHGAKNAVLPILAATLLGGRSTLYNCPALSDVDAAGKILAMLGCILERQDDRITVDARDITYLDLPEQLMREMRSSILFLGAILARCGRACLSFPGGCELGARPIDLHIEGLRRLGASIVEEHGCLRCRIDGRSCRCSKKRAAGLKPEKTASICGHPQGFPPSIRSKPCPTPAFPPTRRLR